jgi:hypothetical protein
MMRSTLNGKFDPTEVDMRLGDLLIEAKLAESDVQESQKAVFHAFGDFREYSSTMACPRPHTAIADLAGAR